MTSVWEETAEEADLAALEPGLPDELDRTPDLLVVGGGVAGLATAAMATRAGMRVTLLESNQRLAAGTSGSAAGGLSPDAHLGAAPGAWVELARRSLALHRELDVEWSCGLRSMDWLVLLPEDGQPSKGSRLGVLDESGAVPDDVAVLDADGVHGLCPDLASVSRAAHLPGQAHVHPLALAAAWVRHAGCVATGVVVEALERRGERIMRVRTSEGGFDPGAVVLATGLAPGELTPQVRVPQRLIKGHLVATEPAPFRLRVGIASGRALVVQLPDGRLVAGGTLDVGDSSPEVRGEVVERIRAEVGRLLPAADGLALTHRWCCFRPATRDTMPIVDRVPECENVWLVAGLFRTGLLVAPEVGRRLASWISEGEPPAELRRFAIDRFADD